jgi:haloacetate dehalogenase
MERFSILAHDRGARVAHRLAIDHPDRVDKLVLLDIAPTLYMYEHTDMRFVSSPFHGPNQKMSSSLKPLSRL